MLPDSETVLRATVLPFSLSSTVTVHRDSVRGQLTRTLAVPRLETSTDRGVRRTFGAVTSVGGGVVPHDRRERQKENADLCLSRSDLEHVGTS